MKNTEEYIYAGIPTFMGSPYIGIDEVKKYDVAILGIPIDFGASYRLGAKYAPRKIREYSFWDRVDGTVYYNLDNNKTLRSNKLKIGDLGDLNIWPTDPRMNNREIIKTVAAIRKTAFPLILGGDHSITYASFIGCKNGLPKNRSLGLLHFDAHLDTEKNYLTLPRIWHGNTFRELIEKKYLNGRDMVTIGPRDIVDKRWFDFLADHNVNLFTAHQVNMMGVEKIMNKTIQILNKNCDSVYVSIDIDCIDISQTPGTGTPKHGGILANDMITIVRMLHKLPIVGLDLVELNPVLDSTGATTVIACDILWNFLAFGIHLQSK